MGKIMEAAEGEEKLNIMIIDTDEYFVLKFNSTI